GIAALVAVTGISASSRADLLAELDELGTNRLQVRAGQSFFGEDATLPAEASDMIRRIAPVQAASGLTSVGETVRRTDVVPEGETGGLSVVAADVDLADTVGATVRDGRFLDEATGQVPAVVLGAGAAERLGIDDVSDGAMVWLGGTWFTVVGILDPVPLLGGLDSSVFIGYDVAEALFGTSRSPDTVHVRTEPGATDAVRGVLAATAAPLAPNEVEVSNPSDALAAKEAVDENLQALLLGLGAVALLVGGIGIANVMVVTVLERRGEIGLRRALGASRRHVRLQFLTEAALLSVLGGAGGVALGAAVTVGWARARGMVVDLPPSVALAGLGAAVLVGMVAGISPASRAARLPPADALRPA
ncbi:MAG: FtsX-like permease family protein, partial [Acidimicrobiia bacterium]|nr:FtsX-like permease family protein [Acidimicrobiia bacterium]